MPNAIIPASDNTYAKNAEGKLTEVVGWEVDTRPSLTIAPLIPEDGFTPTHVIMPDRRRYTYPGWVYDGWGT